MKVVAKIEDNGVDAVLTRITAVAQFGNRGMMQDIGHAWLGFVKEGFTRESEPNGTPWQQLGIRTIKKKKKIGAPQPSRRLFEFGALSKSFGFTAGPKRLRIESSEDTEKVNRHQYGEGRVPARPMLPEPDALPENWQAAIVDAVENLRLRVLR